MKRSASQANIVVTTAPAKKRKSSKKRSASRVYPLHGISSETRAKLRYSAEVSLASSGVGTVVRHTFHANSLYDPDNTGVGGQPPGFDEYMTLYHYYTVVGGKMSAHPINSGTATYAAQYFCVAVSDAIVGTSMNTQSMLCNTPNSDKGSPWSAWGMNRGTYDIDKKERTRSVKWDAAGIMGIKKSDVLTRTTLQGTSTTSPSDTIFGCLLVADVASGGSTTQAYLVTLEFDVVFTGPKDLRVG